MARKKRGSKSSKSKSRAGKVRTVRKAMIRPKAAGKKRGGKSYK